MTVSERNTYLPFVSLFLIVLISRLPFLSAGYGVEEDSWGIALAAFHTKMSGIYEPSRFPGHPVQELIYSALWGSGPFVFNGLSALLSAIAATYFALILRHFSFRHYWIAALAFAFVPVVYISSTYTIDFIWSEAFVLMSFYFLLKERLLICGVFLGLAVGCRITCGVMLIPFMIFIWQKGDLKQNIISFLKISVPMGLVSLIVFLPVIIQFGSSFFMYYDQFPYPPFTKVMYKMIPGVFGFIGSLTLIFFFIIALTKKNRIDHGKLFAAGVPQKLMSISCLIIVLYIISYFRLPQKSGYMLPVVPFVILLFAYLLNSLRFKILCVCLILSSFFCSINLTDKMRGASYSEAAITFTVSGQEIFFDILSGPVFSDYSKRLQKMRYTDDVIKRSEALNKKTVVIAGWWYNEIVVTMIPQTENNNVVFEPYIPEDKMIDYINNGYGITYLPEQDRYNDLMFRISSTNKLARAF